MKVKEIIKTIESFAPIGLQEPWDNSGLIIGDKESNVTGILLSLDITESILDEAAELGCNMIVSHHPMVFSGMKRFTGKDYTSRLVRRAIKEDFIIYSAHTNLDQVPEGVSGEMSKKLGLLETKILVPRKDDLMKLVCFVPSKHLEDVSRAVYDVGAGQIGNYDSCGYSSQGTGTFRAGEGSDPFVGNIGEVHREEEARFETIFTKHLKQKVVTALIHAHPYEEVAYDLYPIVNENSGLGLGLVGNLSEPIGELDFIQKVKNIFGSPCIRHTKLLNKDIRRVAVCGGSGAEFLAHAKGSGADAYITADVKYHQFFDSDSEILLLDIGHYESEQVALSIFNRLFLKKMTNFAVHLSKISTNPINYF